MEIDQSSSVSRMPYALLIEISAAGTSSTIDSRISLPVEIYINNVLFDKANVTAPSWSRHFYKGFIYLDPAIPIIVKALKSSFVSSSEQSIQISFEALITDLKENRKASGKRFTLEQNKQYTLSAHIRLQENFIFTVKPNIVDLAIAPLVSNATNNNNTNSQISAISQRLKEKMIMLSFNGQFDCAGLFNEVTNLQAESRLILQDKDYFNMIDDLQMMQDKEKEQIKLSSYLKDPANSVSQNLVLDYHSSDYTYKKFILMGNQLSRSLQSHLKKMIVLQAKNDKSFESQRLMNPAIKLQDIHHERLVQLMRSAGSAGQYYICIYSKDMRVYRLYWSSFYDYIFGLKVLTAIRSYLSTPFLLREIKAHVFEAIMTVDGLMESESVYMSINYDHHTCNFFLNDKTNNISSNSKSGRGQDISLSFDMVS